jgi:Concanavalin A-like lectin/glucanases superfamily
MTLHFSPQRSFGAGVLLSSLAFLSFFSIIWFGRPAQADVESRPTLYASFDKNVLADQAIGDETPLTNQATKVVREGRKGGAAFLDVGSTLSYDAGGNLYGERGTVAFWWKLDEPLGRTPFFIVRVSQLRQQNADYAFADLLWTGDDLRLRVYDRDSQLHEVVSASKTELVSGRWFHLAFTWDELEGFRLYVDGHESGKKPGGVHLPETLDQMGIHTRTATPQAFSGNERKVFIDELRVYSSPLTAAGIQNLSELGSGRGGEMPSVSSQNPELWNQHWKARFGWQHPESMTPLSSPVWLRKTVPEVKEPKKPSSSEKAAQPAGNVAEKLARVPAANRLGFKLLPSSEALNLQGISRPQIATLYNVRTKLLRRYLPEDQKVWVGVPSELFPANVAPFGSSQETLRYSHIVLPPYLSHTALDSIRLKLNATASGGLGEPLVYISVHDPVYNGRELFSANFRMASASAPEMILDFPDIAVPAGAALWLTLASDQKDFSVRCLTGAEVEMWSSPTGSGPEAEQARREYLGDRLGWIRESFRTLSQTSPWRTQDPVQLRRQSKALDELLAVLEDVARVDPNEPGALSYRGWVRPSITPPDFRQPVPPAGVPLWAFQQQLLLEQMKQTAEWWVRNRQSGAGDFGDGLDQDTRLVTNWPGIALMEGPASELRDSLFRLLKACDSRGLLKQGFSALRGDPEQVYQQGLNLLPAAVLLDYGNPIWVERLMESARHLERISDTNSAGHRHLRSYLLSATDVVEEGYHAREDVHSALLWHSALALAWYNRNPRVLRWLTETADALLAHWEKDRYLKLSLGIRFFSDEVISRGLPEPERMNLLWGMFRLTGDRKYLRAADGGEGRKEFGLLDALNQGGELGLAETIGGRWLEFLENAELCRQGVLNLVGERNIWDRNLQGDESGLWARQHAFELTGSKRYLEDYQGALLKHISQNRVMYTEAEPCTGHVEIPHKTLQRARLGGIAYHHSMLYPGHSVSWEGADGKLAALVLKANGSSIKLTVFNFAKSLLDVTLRIWDLENGTYSVVEGTDVTGNDRIDVETTRRTLPLRRGSAIPLSLRAQKTTVIEIKPVTKGIPLGELPDLAMAVEELKYDPITDKGSLVIHNIGAKKSPPFVLQVENERRVVLLKKQLEALEAPLDLVPKRMTVELSGIKVGASRLLTFKLDPDNQVEEITHDNNVLRKSLN